MVHHGIVRETKYIVHTNRSIFRLSLLGRCMLWTLSTLSTIYEISRSVLCYPEQSSKFCVWYSVNFCQACKVVTGYYILFCFVFCFCDHATWVNFTYCTPLDTPFKNEHYKWPSANYWVMFLKSQWTLVINNMKQIIKSIFFMVYQIANRMFEILWNFPKIPQKSFAVFRWNQKA